MRKIFLTIVIVCMCLYTLGACKTYGKDHTKHTGEWQANESTHYYQYTCGCPSPDIAELHLDGNGDRLCDVCSYQMAAEGENSNNWKIARDGCVVVLTNFDVAMDIINLKFK